MPHALRLVATFFCLAVLTWSTVTPPAVAAPAIDDGQTWAPDVANHIPADQTNLFFIGDLVPAAKAILEDPDIRRFLMEGRTGFWIRESDGGLEPEDLDPRQAVFAMKQGERYVPEEIAFAWSDDAAETLARLFEAGLTGFLTVASIDEGLAQAEIDALHKDLLGHVQALVNPRVTLAMMMRDENTAAELFGYIMMGIGFAQQQGVRVEMLADGMKLGITIGDLVGEEDLTDALVEAGLARDGDAQLPNVVAAIRKFSLDFKLVREGSAILFKFGPEADDAPMLGENVMDDMMVRGPEPLLYSAANIEPFREAVGRAKALLQRIEGTPVYEAALSRDAIGLLSLPEQFELSLAEAGSHMESKVYYGQGLHSLTLIRGAKPGQAIAESPLLAMLPGDGAGYALDGTTSLGEVIRNTMAQLDDKQIARSILEAQADFGDGPDEHALTQYIEHTAELRHLMEEVPAKLFQRPTAGILDLKGKLELATLNAIDGGEDNIIRLGPADVPEYAIIAATTDEAACLQWVKDVSRALPTAIFNVIGEEVPEGVGVVGEVELAPGITALTPDLDWFGQLVATQEPDAGLKIEVQGDALPHIVVHDGVMVWSTSMRLSRAIFEKGFEPVELPDAPGTLTGAASVDVAKLGQGVTMLLDVIKEAQVESRELEQEDMAEVAQALTAASEIINEWLGLFSYGTHMVYDEGGVRVMQTSLHTAE